MSSSNPPQASAAVKVGEALRSCDVFVLFDVFVLLLVVGLTVGLGSAGSDLPNHRTSIALGERIGPVSYGEPQARITGALGRGLVVLLEGNKFRSYPLYHLYVAYPPIYASVGPGQPSFRVQLGDSTAAAIVMTRSPEYRTHSGVGVGTSLQQLEQRIPVACSIATGMSTPTKCQYQNQTATTVFTINSKTKRVTQVALVPVNE